MPINVLIHAPERAALIRARSNAKNLLAARPDAVVEIVVNATGVEAALDTPDPDTDGMLRVCANTLAAKGLVAPDELTVVPAAVVHLAERQGAGWAYIRA